MSLEFINQDHDADDNMLAEYDFSHAVQGKHYPVYQQGYAVVVHKADGTTETRAFALPEGTVVLEPDVRTYFLTSEAVNQALRGLIALIPSPQPI